MPIDNETNHLIINKLESFELYEYLKEKGLLQEEEVYILGFEGLENKIEKNKPVLGVDYWTEEDKTEIKLYINNAIYGIVDGTIENFTNEKATYIRDYGFYQHESLKKATFSLVTNIGEYSFYKCPQLTEINTLNVTEIGDFAFKGCTVLPVVNFPLLTQLGKGCFDECISLSAATLSMVTAIKPLTFRKCESLTTLNLPKVTNIGTRAFYSSNIASLTLSSNTLCTLESEDAFYFTPIENGTGYIYVPSSLVNSYKTAANWSVYANQIRAIQ